MISSSRRGDIFIGLYTMHERGREADRQTDGHQATTNTALTHSVARKKNPVIFLWSNSKIKQLDVFETQRT